MTVMVNSSISTCAHDGNGTVSTSCTTNRHYSDILLVQCSTETSCDSGEPAVHSDSTRFRKPWLSTIELGHHMDG